jgi:hypothetical protein
MSSMRRRGYESEVGLQEVRSVPGHQVVGKGFQGAPANLPRVLGLDHEPVVLGVGDEIAGQGGGRAQVASVAELPERRPAQWSLCGPAVHGLACEA